MLYRTVFCTGKSMTLSGQPFDRGQIVPDSVLSAIPPHRLGSLVRTGLLLESREAVPEATDEVSTAGVVESTVEPVEAVSEDMCPQCGEGPFVRLARHITAKHEELEEALSGSD